MASLLNSVKGHQTQIEHLLHSIKQNRLASSFLFVGPSGVGKKMVAKGLAQYLNCKNSPPPCGHCPLCLRLEKGVFEDLILVEPNEPQIKIEQIREIIKILSLKNWGNYRIIIVDDAHLMTIQASNALLKSLEEPPPSTYFFLITNSEHSILPTIRSRCLLIRFGQLENETLKSLTGVTGWMLNLSQGQIDWANKLKDEEWQNKRVLILNYFESLLNNDRIQGFELLQPIGKDRSLYDFFCMTLRSFIRDILFFKLKIPTIINTDQIELIKKMSTIDSYFIDKMNQLVNKMEKESHTNVDKTLLLENIWIEFQSCFYPA